MGNVLIEVNEVKATGRFIDCRFSLADTTLGKQQFEQGHMKGAVYFDLEDDLSDMTKISSGRHPMPEKSSLLALFEGAGLTFDDTIYVYDGGGEPFAARGYYMLVYAGFPDVYIVNGGFDALVEAGFEVTTEVASFAPSVITPMWNESIYASREDVFAVTKGSCDALLVDARAAKRYAGEFEPLDPVAGHIPTAMNFDWEQLKTGGKLVVTDDLLTQVPKDHELVVYCGSGVTASPLYATLKEAGYDKVKLYVGSYSDWINEHEVEK